MCISVRLLTIVYGVILILALFTSPEFLAISFDASGATTGALTVPFILSLAIGVSKLKKDSKSSEKDSFGLVGIASTGAIISVMIMSIISDTDKITGSLETTQEVSSSIVAPFIEKLPIVSAEVAIALVPILLIFLFFQKKLQAFSKYSNTPMIFPSVHSSLASCLQASSRSRVWQ